MYAFNEELTALELVCQQHHDFQLEEWQKRQVQSIHSDNLRNQSKGIAQYLYIEQIFYIILGIISFAIVDRLSSPIDVDDFANILLNNNIPINVILAKKQVIGIDTKEDYKELKKILEYKA